MKVKTMANIFDVAKYILENQKTTTAIKLHRLVYFCHVEHMTKKNKPLVNEIFTACDMGAVCPTLYNNIIKVVAGNPNHLSQDEVESINSVLRFFKNKTSFELIEICKSQKPVQDALKSKNKEITNDMILNENHTTISQTY